MREKGTLIIMDLLGNLDKGLGLGVLRCRVEGRVSGVRVWGLGF